MDALALPHAGWLSILPPVIAIILALTTKEVISSLLIGVLAGGLIFSKGNPLGMVVTTFEIMGEKMGGNANILIFLGLLGAIVVIVTKAGGSAAYGEWAARKISSRRGAALATSALGCLIFIDDYFNCLTVGTVMRPVTDKHRISRAKLAYLLDATAAPVCIIAPISSWGASVASYMEGAGLGNGMAAFVKTIPYNLYAILTLVMIVIICATNVNFGNMAKFEENAINKGDLFSNDEQRTEEEPGLRDGKALRGKVTDLVVPILALIVCTVVAMIYTGGGFEGGFSIGKMGAAFGECDASLSLVLGSFFALVITFILYMPRKVLSFHDFMGGITEGIKSMVPSFVILTLAWTIGGICSQDYLNTGGFVGNLVNDTVFPEFLLPSIIFIIAGFLGFATGTSWGTMALLIPIGAAITTPANTAHLVFPVMGAILAGAVYGDHISPISDTTILSSAGAGCNHIDHVSSQMGYATLVTICAIVGYILIGLWNQPWLGLLVSLICLVAAIFAADRLHKRSKGTT